MKSNLKNWLIKKTPKKIALILAVLYLIFSMVFIFLGDYMLLKIPGVNSTEFLTYLQSLKAVIFLGLTGTLLYVLTFNFFKWFEETKKRSEKELKVSKEKFQKMVEMSPFGIIITHNGRIQFGNRAIVKIFGGKSIDEYIGKHIYDFIHPDYRELIRKRQEALLTENVKTPFARIKAYKLDGSLIDLEITGKSFKIDDKVYVEAIIRDVTELKKVDDDLKKSEERFREAIINAPFPVMIHAEDGEVLELNKAWMEISGYSIEDVPDIKTWTEKAYGKKARNNSKLISKTYSRDKMNYDGEMTLRTKKGEKRKWQFYSAPLVNLGDERMLVISTGIDITDKKVVEKKLEEHQKNLELLVDKRTGELEEKNNELQRINELFVGREFRIKELKDSMKILKEELSAYRDQE